MKGRLMRVTSITLHATESGYKHLADRAASVKVKGITVYPHASWYADLVLSDVSGPEFGLIEDATKRSRELCFRPGSESYAHRQQLAYVQIHRHDLVRDYVERGAPTDPRLTAELAKELEALIQRLMTQ